MKHENSSFKHYGGKPLLLCCVKLSWNNVSSVWSSIPLSIWNKFNWCFSYVALCLQKNFHTITLHQEMWKMFDKILLKKTFRFISTLILYYREVANHWLKWKEPPTTSQFCHQYSQMFYGLSITTYCKQHRPS